MLKVPYSDIPLDVNDFSGYGERSIESLGSYLCDTYGIPEPKVMADWDSPATANLDIGRPNLAKIDYSKGAYYDRIDDTLVASSDSFNKRLLVEMVHELSHKLLLDDTVGTADATSKYYDIINKVAESTKRMDYDLSKDYIDAFGDTLYDSTIKLRQPSMIRYTGRINKYCG